MSIRVWFRALAIASVALTATGLVGLGGLAPATAAGGAISGVAFDDADRDGTRDQGEAAFAGHQVYLLTAAGGYVAGATTDSAGTYSFAAVADGDYLVQYSSPSWWNVRESWVPTTTPGLFPRRTVRVAAAAARADFGWRRLVRSTDLASPISTFTAPDGLRVESFNDAVTATQLHDAIRRGAALASEASTITIRFGYGSTTTCSSAAGTQDGRYTSYAAIVYLAYASWLDTGDTTLFHEYGHAWARYYDQVVQQDGTLSGYLRARGLTGDARVGSAYEWEPDEMIAEDYRQLFGSAGAVAAPQANRDIPAAASVAGLRDYLSTTFRQGSATPPPPAPAPAPAAPPTITSLAMSPTPVTASGTASFSVDVAATVDIAIADAKGNVVKTLVSRRSVTAGQVSGSWDRTNTAGRRVKAGTYSLRASATDAQGRTTTAQVAFKVA